MICRQQETGNYGAVSFIIRIGREYAEKRTNEVLKQKEKRMNGKKLSPATAEESGYQF